MPNGGPSAMVWGVMLYISRVLDAVLIPLYSGCLPAPLSCVSGWPWRNLRLQHQPQVEYVIDPIADIDPTSHKYLALLLDPFACFPSLPEFSLLDSWV